MKFFRTRRKLWLLLSIPIVLLLLAIPAGSIYYTAAGGKACIRCHEIQPAYDSLMDSTHRNVECGACHGSIYSTDAGFHLNNVRQLWRHVRGQVPERLLLRQEDISRGLNARCGKCHQQEYAAWTAGPHHATYGQIFLPATTPTGL
jgi:nitrate/TMAO reductase-like tetraheme cytochrome c subunit